MVGDPLGKILGTPAPTGIPYFYEPGPTRMDETLAKRFWAKVNRSGPTQDHMDTRCWTWEAALSRKGYGVFWANGKNYFAHRFSHLLATGEEPEVVCHKCDCKSCVRPDHLYGGDRFTNAIDAAVRGRLKRGEENNQSKLNPEKIRDIRERRQDGDTLVALAHEFGVSHQAILQIVTRKTWKHVA